MRKILLLFLLSLSFISYSQNPGDIVQTFGSAPGFTGSIYSFVVQNDGKILAGGDFYYYKGVSANKIIRLNADGTRDTSFNIGTGFNNTVISIAIQPDGKILVGGFFTTYKGATENYIIRLNADGSKDTTFNLGTGLSAYVNSIAIQTDGKILVGGNFTSYNGVSEYRIIRLNTDGTKDASFISGIGFNSFIRSIAVQADGKILVGGNFTSYKGVAQSKIIRLNTDGSKDTSFNIGTGFDATVISIVAQADGKILVGGFFTTYKGITENRIIRLNTNGNKDTSFTTGVGFNNEVLSIAVQNDGKILLGGGFSSYNGVTENRIIRLNTDGTKDTSFSAGIGFSHSVLSIALQNDGKILIGGDFIVYNGVAENKMTRLNADGTKDISFSTGTGFNGYVNAIAEQTDGKILIGGSFNSFKRMTEKGIIRLNADGTKDVSFTTGTILNTFWVYSIVVQNDGKIIVGGYFSDYNGITENNIIRLNADGTKDTSFTTGVGFNDYSYTIALQADGKILIGGAFTAYNGVTENRIIRLNADGTKDTSFVTGTGFNNNVKSIVVQTDGKILVGGYFTAYNGVTENRIIRLNADGTKDTSFTTGNGFSSSVDAMAMQTDGKILAGGDFNSYKGVSENKIIRLNIDGTKDTSFTTGDGFNSFVMSITVQNNGKIIITGAFNVYDVTPENRVVRLNSDGTKDTSFTTGTGFETAAYCSLSVQNDEKILIGGQFATYNGNSESAALIGLYSEGILSTGEFTNTNAFSLYPNPVKDILNIDLLDNTSISSAKIFDLQGKLILEKASNDIDVSSLSAGLYLIKIATEKGEFTKKFIKE
jgi:uncharacterized delta-60 repeat protein